MSVGEITRLESGECADVRIGALVAVAAALGLSLAQLVDAGERRA